jgi:hypothetical protein
MRFKLIVLTVCVILPVCAVNGQRRSHKVSPLRIAPLEKVGEYPNRPLAGTFKISNIVLEDVRPVENHWVYVSSCMILGLTSAEANR